MGYDWMLDEPDDFDFPMEPDEVFNEDVDPIFLAEAYGDEDILQREEYEQRTRVQSSRRYSSPAQPHASSWKNSPSRGSIHRQVVAHSARKSQEDIEWKHLLAHYAEQIAADAAARQRTHKTKPLKRQ